VFKTLCFLDRVAIVGIIAAVGLAIFFQLRSEMKNQTKELKSQTSNFTETQKEMNTMNTLSSAHPLVCDIPIFRKCICDLSW
jgi:hypothetical protein